MAGGGLSKKGKYGKQEEEECCGKVVSRHLVDRDFMLLSAVGWSVRAIEIEINVIFIEFRTELYIQQN